MDSNDRRVMRLLIKVYQGGWKDAINSLITAKNATCDPMEKVYKMLLEEDSDDSPTLGDNSSSD